MKPIPGNCDSCGASVRVGAKKCPRCEVYLNQEFVKASAIENLITAQALRSARNICIFNPVAYLMIAIAIGRFLINFPLHHNLVITIIWLIPLVLIGGWFIRYGTRDSSDYTFLEIKRQMKTTFSLWLSMNMLNWFGFLKSLS